MEIKLSMSTTTQFYGFKVTKEGKQLFQPLTETVRHRAENELVAICKESKLGYGGVYIVQGTQRQAGTLLKQFGDKTPTPRKKGRGKR